MISTQIACPSVPIPWGTRNGDTRTFIRHRWIPNKLADKGILQDLLEMHDAELGTQQAVQV